MNHFSDATMVILRGIHLIIASMTSARLGRFSFSSS